MTTRPEVFISYARGESRDFADAIQNRLGGAEHCFVDRSNIEIQAEFPTALVEAMLGSRVVIAILGPRYAKSGYCWKEWLIALGPLSAARARRLDDKAKRAARAHVVPALHPDASLESQLMLLGPLAIQNLPRADDVDALASAIERILATTPKTLRELFAEFQVDPKLEEILTDPSYVAQLPMKQGRVPCYPIRQHDSHASLGAGFVGRADDFQGLHWALAAGVEQGAAALTASLVGHGGYGKTRLALEYFHRLGPVLYPGGNVWLDASGDAEGRSLGDQLVEIDRVLRERHSDLDIPEAEDPRDSLALSLGHVGERKPILWVIDNLPDTGPVGRLSDYCPAAKEVSIVITTRRRVDWPGVTNLSLDVLEPAEAVALLQRGLVPNARAKLSEDQWRELAEAVGRLPLVLEILNAALVSRLGSVETLFARVSQGDPAAETDAICADLQELLPERALRGIVAAFRSSLEGLENPDTRELLLRLAWLAPAPVPHALLVALAVDPERADLALARLDQTSWLPARDADDHRQLHRVLAAFLRAEQPFAEATERVKSVSATIESGLSAESPAQCRSLDELTMLAPHVSGLSENALRVPSNDTWGATRSLQITWGRMADRRLGNPPHIFQSPDGLMEDRRNWCFIDRLGLIDLVEAWKDAGFDFGTIEQRLLDYRDVRRGERIAQAQVLQALEYCVSPECTESPRPPLPPARYSEYFRNCGLPDRGTTLIDMIPIPPDGLQFEAALGSPTGDPASEAWETPSQRRVIDPFLLASTPITWEQFASFDLHRRPATKGNESAPRRPITGVTWWDAWMYCRWMGGDLPTEVQWESACRAGSRSRWFFGDKESDLERYAWTAANSGNEVQEVATRERNPWGLFDMHGNVWEWCRDWWRPYLLRQHWNRRSPNDVWGRVVRGGCACDIADWTRSAFRNWELPWLGGQFLGFRLALSVS